jgi:hypothetical protein
VSITARFPSALLDRGFEVVDEIEEDVDVDGFRNEGEVADR